MAKRTDSTAVEEDRINDYEPLDRVQEPALFGSEDEP